MISSNDFTRGVVIKMDGDIYAVLEYQHVKPARGASFVRTKLRSLTKGAIIDRRFAGGEKLEDVEVENRPMQYLYSEDEGLVFMDTESFDQVTVDKTMAGNILDFIKEGDVCQIAIYDERPIAIDPPTFVTLKVTYAEPGVRGDTATNVTKKVKVETGAEFNVPIFVNEGDLLKIDTRSGEYVERAKK
jgi:elongation factor P